MQVKQISDNEIHVFIKYTKRVLWRVAKRLFYIEDARCLKVNLVHGRQIRTGFGYEVVTLNGAIMIGSKIETHMSISFILT